MAECVAAYPRPPALLPCSQHVRVEALGREVGQLHALLLKCREGAEAEGAARAAVERDLRTAVDFGKALLAANRALQAGQAPLPLAASGGVERSYYSTSYGSSYNSMTFYGGGVYYGGSGMGGGGGGSTSFSGANAYMLMYRKVLPGSAVEVATRELGVGGAGSTNTTTTTTPSNNSRNNPSNNPATRLLGVEAEDGAAQPVEVGRGHEAPHYHFVTRGKILDTSTTASCRHRRLALSRLARLDASLYAARLAAAKPSDPKEGVIRKLQRHFATSRGIAIVFGDD
jgi:hypothetical protein